MKFPPALLAFAILSSGLAGADNSVTPEQVVVQVGKNLAAYKTLEYAYELQKGAAPFQVKTWLDDGVFRRVTASQSGNGGVLTRDFYYDGDGGLRFVLGTLSGDPKEARAAAVEERFEFSDEELTTYTGADKQPVPKGSPHFTEMEKALLAMSNDLVARIEGSTAYATLIGGANPAGKKVPAGTVFGAGYADGSFSGIEKAEYYHLDLLEEDGEIETFFVITKDKSVDPFLSAPEKQKGRKIRVHWIERMQPIPQAGGATRLKVCDSIELLK